MTLGELATLRQSVSGFTRAADLEQKLHHDNKLDSFLVNHHNCRVWPEAWVAFAHRSKKIATNFSLGTFRYAEGDSEARASDPTLLGSRAEALEAVERAKTEKAPRW